MNNYLQVDMKSKVKWKPRKLHHITLRELRALAKQAGCRIIESTAITAFYQYQVFEREERLMSFNGDLKGTTRTKAYLLGIIEMKKRGEWDE